MSLQLRLSPPQASADLGDPTSMRGTQGLLPSCRKVDQTPGMSNPQVMWAVHQSHTCLFAPEPHVRVESRGRGAAGVLRVGDTAQALSSGALKRGRGG